MYIYTVRAVLDIIFYSQQQTLLPGYVQYTIQRLRQHLLTILLLVCH